MDDNKNYIVCDINSGIEVERLSESELISLLLLRGQLQVI